MAAFSIINYDTSADLQIVECFGYLRHGYDGSGGEAVALRYLPEVRKRCRLFQLPCD